MNIEGFCKLELARHEAEMLWRLLGNMSDLEKTRITGTSNHAVLSEIYDQLGLVFNHFEWEE